TNTLDKMGFPQTGTPINKERVERVITGVFCYGHSCRACKPGTVSFYVSVKYIAVIQVWVYLGFSDTRNNKRIFNFARVLSGIASNALSLVGWHGLLWQLHRAAFGHRIRFF